MIHPPCETGGETDLVITIGAERGARRRAFEIAFAPLAAWLGWRRNFPGPPGECGANTAAAA